MRFSALGGAIAAAMILLTGCSIWPVEVAGVPAGSPWAALPLKRWLSEGRAEPEAVAVCQPPDCAPGLAVGVIRLQGQDARTAAALLADPSPLVRHFSKPGERKPKLQTYALAKPLTAGTARGFSLALGRADREGRPAFGAALGQEAGNDLRVVLVVGSSEEAVETTARRVAREHLGS